MTPITRPLDGQVAIVAGATRGAGRGIARALGEAGAIVYCSGRSTRGNPSAYKRPETIDETAEMIGEAGGRAFAVPVDHSVESEVEALIRRVDAEQGRLDVLVNCIGGEAAALKRYGWFWTATFDDADAALRGSLVSHAITAKHAAPLMVRARRGLIVGITENDLLMGGGNPVAQIVKLGVKGLAFAMAAELRTHGVTAVALTPGFLRSEAMLEHFGVTEANWRDGGRADRNFLVSESPLYVGRAVAALAADPDVIARSGQLCSSWELAREYGFTDVDGSRPDWGAHAIDFSECPEEFLEYFRAGTEMQIASLTAILDRTRQFRAKIPGAAV